MSSDSSLLLLTFEILKKIERKYEKGGEREEEEQKTLDDIIPIKYISCQKIQYIDTT
jgi:hypothetical protein